MSKERVKIKDLAKKYGVSATLAIKELEPEGFEFKSATSVVPEDSLQLIEEFFAGLADKTADEPKDSGGKQPTSRSDLKEIHIKPPLVVKSLAEALGAKPNEIVSRLMKMNVLANINQTITPEVATKLCKKMGLKLVLEKRGKDERKPGAPGEALEDSKDESDPPESLVERPPIVAFLGHVDHGKTSLQDKIRSTRVVAKEAGGITQHIGASSISYKSKKITFVDTPGHAAFTAMRARGANVTDIAILVVAADDGFMPQTVEALNHIRAAEVPVIIAINKIDLPDANPDKVLLHMQQNNLMSEDWGGDIGAIRVSAETGEGLDNLLERIILESEMLEIRANPSRRAVCVVVEAQLEQGLGPTSNVIVTNGTLKLGDSIICGRHYGKVKAMVDEHGNRVAQAPPSMPVKVVGLGGVPEAGDKVIVCANEREAKELAAQRDDELRQQELTKEPSSEVSEDGGLEELFAQFNQNQRNNLKLVLKTDVKGSAEAIIDSLKKLPSEKINVDVVLSGVGAISENDVLLASASKALVVGFQARVNPGVNALAKKSGVEIRLYSIIYELLEDITDALSGRLAPDKREKEVGTARIKQIFDVSKGPKVCGCVVESGLVRVGASARVFRGQELIFNGAVRSLRRFQDDVKEVRQGLECGIRLENFLDFQENDVIQVYEIEMRKATLA